MKAIFTLKAKETFLNNIKSLMKAHGWSYKDLGDKIGVSKQQVSNWINEDRWASETTVQSMAKAFKLEETDLFDPNLSKRLKLK